ncbi:MAG: hypothetical protein WCP46_07730 [Alphaproteobacteria bacterium]
MKIILTILAIILIEINACSSTENYLEREEPIRSRGLADLDVEVNIKPHQSKANRAISNSLIATGTALGVSAVWFYGNHLLYSVGYYLAESNAPTSGFTYYFIGQQSYHLAGVAYASSPFQNAILTAVGSIVGATIGHITARSFEKTVNFISRCF